MARPKHKEKSKTYRIDLKPSEVEKSGGWNEVKKVLKSFVKSKNSNGKSE